MKKLIAMLLALIMVCSLATTAFATSEAPSEETTCPICGPEGPVYNCPDHGCVDAKEEDCKKLCAFHGNTAPNMVMGNEASFTKKYEVKGGTAPKETFDFEHKFVSYLSHDDINDANATASTTEPAGAPVVTLGTLNTETNKYEDAKFSDHLTATGTATVPVVITEYDDAPLGIYTYEITEKPGTTAGVNYTAEKILLVVTILRDESVEDEVHNYVAALHYETEDGEKVVEVINEYEAGKLTVTKDLIGNMANMSDEFDFTVIFTPETSTYAKDAEGNFETTVFNEIQISGGTKVDGDEPGTVKVTFTLGDGEEITISNIPYGTSYIISEDAQDYDNITHTNDSGTIGAGNDDITAEFVNERTSEVDTGVALDSAPYILMLVVAMVGVVALVSKKRYEV